MWVNEFRSTLSYNASNMQTGSIGQYWGGSSWVNSIQSINSYDGDNNLVDFTFQTWVGSAWVNWFRFLHYYSSSTDVEGEIGLASEFNLSNNYPNPFNPSTRINFTIPHKAVVSLRVFSLSGSEVAELVSGEMEAGSYDIDFDAANLPSGVYFYKIQSDNFVQTKKMLLLK
jgi:hypothetical protein